MSPLVHRDPNPHLGRLGGLSHQSAWRNLSAPGKGSTHSRSDERRRRVTSSRVPSRRDLPLPAAPAPEPACLRAESSSVSSPWTVGSWVIQLRSPRRGPSGRQRASKHGRVGVCVRPSVCLSVPRTTAGKRTLSQKTRLREERQESSNPGWTEARRKNAKETKSPL